MTTPADLLNHFQAELDAALVVLQQLVELESCSRDKEGVDRLADFLGRKFLECGSEVELSRLAGSGNILKATWHGAGAGSPIVFLGHLDTVWPRGTILERPFLLKDDRAYGPGVHDMKGGILLCLLVCRACQSQWVRPQGDIVFFFTSDEEIGTDAGLPLLEPVARASRAVLCLEPPLPGGKAKTFRKGVGTFHLHATGIAAHAGVDHHLGANAILELCHQVIKLHRMNDDKRGITLSVGRIQGGGAVNVIPHSAEAEVDFRFPELSLGRRLERRIQRLRPRDPRCRITIKGGINRPPLKRTPAVSGLYELAKSVAASIGMELGEGETGGGSDGSFTAALGIPTLDGLGVEGGGAHSTAEYVQVSDIPRRAALLSLLAQELLK